MLPVAATLWLLLPKKVHVKKAEPGVVSPLAPENRWDVHMWEAPDGAFLTCSKGVFIGPSLPSPPLPSPSLPFPSLPLPCERTHLSLT